jgi:hypothetical protein
MQRISKGLYLGGIIASMGFVMLLSILSMLLIMDRDQEAGTIVAAITLIPLIFFVILWAFLVYKMWSAIQDGQARTSPGQAVGYLFIPFYNFYWVFVATWGFAKDYNAYIKRHNLNVPALPEALFLWYAILAVAGVVIGFIPGINILHKIAAFVILIIMVTKICDGVNALPATLPPAQPSVESQIQS